jgi:hypothetical protein
MYFIFGLKDLYFIFTYTPSLFSLYFCSPSTSFREHFKCRWNSWTFWFASSCRKQCRRAPARAKTYCCKEEGFLNISLSPPLWCKLFFLHPGCNPLSVFEGVTLHGKMQLVTKSSNHKHFTVFFLQFWFVCFFPQSHHPQPQQQQ